MIWTTPPYYPSPPQATMRPACPQSYLLPLAPPLSPAQSPMWFDGDNSQQLTTVTSSPVIVAAGHPSSLVDCCDSLLFVAIGESYLPSFPFLSSLSRHAPSTLPMSITDWRQGLTLALLNSHVIMLIVGSLPSRQRERLTPTPPRAAWSPPFPKPERNERCTSTPVDVKQCKRRPPQLRPSRERPRSHRRKRNPLQTLSGPQAPPLPLTLEPSLPSPEPKRNERRRPLPW
jgi:hypothetical protein